MFCCKKSLYYYDFCSGLMVEETRVDVTIGEVDPNADSGAQRKERPVWLVESTIANDQVRKEFKSQKSILIARNHF